jgi:uncharacterized membrane protein
MALKQYRALLLVVCVVAALFVASPLLQKFTVAPQTDSFTELWLLGPLRNATYPSNVTEGESYHFSIDVSNHLGSGANYVLEVKFASQTKDAPDSFKHTASSLPSIKSMTVPVADGETVELPVDVSFHYSPKAGNSDQLDMQSISLNDEDINLYSTLDWNPDRSGFYGGLIFELWIHNDTTNTLQYHQRYVSLWLKMT